MFIFFIILALLFIHSPLVRVNKAKGVISGTQDKGGIVPPKPRATPRLSPQTPTSSSPRRKTTAPAQPRQSVPQIEMVLIPTGMFMMGSPDGVGSDSEHPQHRVRMKSFHMGRYEVTQAQYRAVMGTNPSESKGDDLPVENVSWNDAKEFCRKLSQMTGKEYRLPSEAQWEYACRGGTTTAFAFGDSLSSGQANFNGNYPYGGAAKGVDRDKTTPVGSFQPNGWGMYDMHGNVWEWCEDYWHTNYNGAPSYGSAWLVRGSLNQRILRGGSWDFGAEFCRSADRQSNRSDSRGSVTGFRLVAVARTQ